MAKKRAYNFVYKLIDKITTSPSNNMEFICYRHLVGLSSGTADYVSVTLYNTTDRYEGEIAEFSFDYLTKELHFEFSENEILEKKITDVFKTFYPSMYAA